MADTDPQPNTEPVLPGHVPIVEAPPPDRIGFDDHGAIDGEPHTDAKIVLESGLELRERMVEADLPSSSPAGAAPTDRTIIITNALLASDGSVERDEEGQIILSTRHELTLSNETLGRLGTPEAVEQAIKDAREIAAAKADMEFRGVTLHRELLASRTRLPKPPEAVIPAPDQTG